MNKKTNVMRILDSHNIDYKTYDYSKTEAISGYDVANALNQDPNSVFKTLVAVGKSGKHYVFVVPVSSELNLKKAAKSVGEKQVEMIKQKDLLPLTGYIHGGCSPIGLKKPFSTVIDISVENLDNIIFSAGKIGHQVEVSPKYLKEVISYSTADITMG